MEPKLHPMIGTLFYLLLIFLDILIFYPNREEQTSRTKGAMHFVLVVDVVMYVWIGGDQSLLLLHALVGFVLTVYAPKVLRVLFPKFKHYVYNPPKS